MNDWMQQHIYVRLELSVSPNSDESGKQSRYLDGDPDRHQNANICSISHCQPSLKISCKSVRKFLRKIYNRQTNKQRRLHIRLGGGINSNLAINGRSTVARHQSAVINTSNALNSRTISPCLNNIFNIYRVVITQPHGSARVL